MWCTRDFPSYTAWEPTTGCLNSSLAWIIYLKESKLSSEVNVFGIFNQFIGTKLYSLFKLTRWLVYIIAINGDNFVFHYSTLKLACLCWIFSFKILLSTALLNNCFFLFHWQLWVAFELLSRPPQGKINSKWVKQVIVLKWVPECSHSSASYEWRINLWLISKIVMAQTISLLKALKLLNTTGKPNKMPSRLNNHVPFLKVVFSIEMRAKPISLPRKIMYTQRYFCIRPKQCSRFAC